MIASHPSSADTAFADYTRSVYLDDGVFDRGPTLEGALGVDAIAGVTFKPQHEEAIQGGLVHSVGLPLIDLRDAEAFVTSYLQILSSIPRPNRVCFRTMVHCTAIGSTAWW